jgi:hypothetical protein
VRVGHRQASVGIFLSRPSLDSLEPIADLHQSTITPRKFFTLRAPDGGMPSWFDGGFGGSQSLAGGDRQSIAAVTKQARSRINLGVIQRLGNRCEKFRFQVKFIKTSKESSFFTSHLSSSKGGFLIGPHDLAFQA